MQACLHIHLDSAGVQGPAVHVDIRESHSLYQGSVHCEGIRVRVEETSDLSITSVSIQAVAGAV